MQGASGWAAARVGTCCVFMFAGEYRHRPSHLDGLHLHVRIDGTEVIADPGTYSYNAEWPWNNALAGAHVHNAPIVDQREPGERGPRFLWLSWPKARIVNAEAHNGQILIVAERPEAVRREVRVENNGVTVVDTILDRAAKTLEVCWLLHPDADTRFAVEADGANLQDAKEGEVRGWFSPTYGCRLASRYVLIERSGGALVSGIETRIGRRP